MKIAFLTSLDAQDKRSWSGTYYYMAQAIEKHVGDIIYLGPVDNFIHKVLKKGLRLIQPFFTLIKYKNSHSILLSVYYAQFFKRQLKDKDIDLILAPAASVEIAFLKTNIPVVYLSDTTFNQIINYYPEFSDLSSISRYEGSKIEKLAISKADVVMFPTKWAADSAIQDCGANPDKTHVIPLGANIEKAPPIECIEKRLKDRNKCTLLFLAKEWERKGGPLAVATYKNLLKKGLDVELIVCGCELPESYAGNGIIHISFLNKNNPAEYQQFQDILAKTNFLFLPTRAECYGMVFCEASAYGIPSITTATGGVTGVVTDGVNGFALDEKATAEEYSDLIYSNFTNEKKYASLVCSTREQYDKTLNWDVWGKKFSQIVNHIK